MALTRRKTRKPKFETGPRRHCDDFRVSNCSFLTGFSPPTTYHLLPATYGSSRYDQAWAGRVETVVGGTRVNFIGREALILNKRLTGRAQDKADLEALDASQEP